MWVYDDVACSDVFVKDVACMKVMETVRDLHDVVDQAADVRVVVTCGQSCHINSRKSRLEFLYFPDN